MILCLTDEAFGRTLPFLFLDDVKKRFLSDFGNKWQTSVAFAFQTDFGRVLRQLGEYYSNDMNADRIKKVQGAIGEVRDVMMENIEKVLARGERIEDTMKRTDEMANNALQFKKTSTSLKRAMWWKNVKLIIIIAIVIVIIAYIIAAAVCKSPIFKGCWKKKNPSPAPRAMYNIAKPTGIVL